MLNIDNVLLGNRFNVDDRAHITLNKDVCKDCTARSCVVICPAGCFKMSDRNEISFSYGSCLECGSCRIVCTRDAISWKYPRGGYGICYCVS